MLSALPLGDHLYKFKPHEGSNGFCKFEFLTKNVMITVGCNDKKLKIDNDKKFYIKYL